MTPASHPSFRGEAEMVGAGVRCCHGNCGLIFLSIGDWWRHRRHEHGHHTGLDTVEDAAPALTRPPRGPGRHLRVVEP